MQHTPTIDAGGRLVIRLGKAVYYMIGNRLFREVQRRPLAAGSRRRPPITLRYPVATSRRTARLIEALTRHRHGEASAGWLAPPD